MKSNRTPEIVKQTLTTRPLKKITKKHQIGLLKQNTHCLPNWLDWQFVQCLSNFNDIPCTCVICRSVLFPTEDLIVIALFFFPYYFFFQRKTLLLFFCFFFGCIIFSEGLFIILLFLCHFLTILFFFLTDFV